MNDSTTQQHTGPGAKPSSLDEFLGRSAPSPRVRLARRVAGAVAIALLAWLAWTWISGGDDDRPRYATAPVERGNLRVTVSATGNLQPTNEVEVGSELSGLVTEVAVDNNDRVSKSQVLARLDT